MHYSTYFIPFLPIHLFSNHYIQTCTKSQNLLFLPSFSTFPSFHPFFLLEISFFANSYRCEWCETKAHEYSFIQIDRQMLLLSAILLCISIIIIWICMLLVHAYILCIFLIQKYSSPKKKNLSLTKRELKYFPKSYKIIWHLGTKVNTAVLKEIFLNLVNYYYYIRSYSTF